MCPQERYTASIEFDLPHILILWGRKSGVRSFLKFDEKMVVSDPAQSHYKL